MKSYSRAGLIAKITSLLLCGQFLLAPLARAEVTMAVSDWPSWVAWYIAEEKGFFKKHGATVKLVWYDTISKMLDDFNAGKLDANNQTWSDTMSTLAEGTPVKVILATDNSAGADALMVGASIKRLADLKGKTIALETGTVSHFVLAMALNRAKLTEKDIKLSNLPASDAAKALMEGKVDAAVVYNPFVNELQASGKARPLFSSRDMPGLIADVLAVSEKSLKEKRAEYLGIVQAWFDTEAFLRSNREEAIGIMAKVVKQQPEQYKIFLPSVRFLNAKDNAEAFAGAQNTRSLEAVAAPIIKFLSDNQLLKSSVDARKALDGSLVKQAAR